MERAKSELIAAARALHGEFKLRKSFTAGAVAAALRAADGKIYTGICIDLGSGLGFCAEVAAIADMLKHRQTQIAQVVAVNRHGILPPCGRCREMMAQVDQRNFDCRVILSDTSDVPLRELLPRHWMEKT